MAGYIEREKVLALQTDLHFDDIEQLKHWKCRHIDPTDVELLPAADVREVVRCRECQNSYEWANVDGDNYRYCGYLRGRWNHDNDRMVDDDDFCKWGRKKEADDGT